MGVTSTRELRTTCTLRRTLLFGEGAFTAITGPDRSTSCPVLAEQMGVLEPAAALDADRGCTHR